MSIFERGLCVYLQFLYFTLHHGICTCQAVLQGKNALKLSQSDTVMIKVHSGILGMGDPR